MRLEFDDEDYDFEGEVRSTTESVVEEILAKMVRDRVKIEVEKAVSPLVEQAIGREVDRRMVAFMDEEIALTGRWGEKHFVGSIEDLIKMRFDEKLLQPVDSGGRPVQGCTSSTKTWLEWAIEKELGGNLKRKVEDAQRAITKNMEVEVKRLLTEHFDKAAKETIAERMADLLKR